MQHSDVLIIGGGHNGLVCAAYLATAGLRVRVLERRGVVGGAAATVEFHPGFRNSLASYTVSLLNPRVIRDLRLVEHGLRIVERPFANFLPLPDGRSFRFGGEHTQAEVAKWSVRDAQRLPAYYAMLERVVVVLRELMTRTPPNVSDGFVLADWLQSVSVARKLRGLKRARVTIKVTVTPKGGAAQTASKKITLKRKTTTTLMLGHTFATPGTHTVTLTVQDELGMVLAVVRKRPLGAEREQLHPVGGLEHAHAAHRRPDEHHAVVPAQDPLHGAGDRGIPVGDDRQLVTPHHRAGDAVQRRPVAAMRTDEDEPPDSCAGNALTGLDQRPRDRDGAGEQQRAGGRRERGQGIGPSEIPVYGTDGNMGNALAEHDH